MCHGIGIAVVLIEVERDADFLPVSERRVSVAPSRHSYFVRANATDWHGHLPREIPWKRVYL
jgi:hypothetical protein